MIRFEKKKLIIEVEAFDGPGVYLRELQMSLLNVMCRAESVGNNEDKSVLESFMMELIPDEEMAGRTEVKS